MWRWLGEIQLSLMLLSLVCTDLGAAIRDFHFIVDHFKVEGDNPLDEQETQAILAQHERQSHNLDSLRKASKDLETVIREKGYVFYRVILPSQALGKSSEVTLQVVSFKVGEIQIKENNHFDRENLEASLPHLAVGEVPDNESTSNDIKVANNHPAKKLSLQFQQMEESEALAAVLNVKEQNPQSVTLTMNNRGTKDTGAFRTGIGYQYANLFGLDHVINFNFMTSPDRFKEVKQYGINYMLPIYKTRAWLSVYWAKSSVNIGSIGDFSVAGSGDMGGVHYLQFLPRLKNYEHQLDIGLDDKLFNNSLMFGTQQLGTNVRSRPFSLSYRCSLAGSGYQTSLNLSWSKNIVDGLFNNASSYRSNRHGAKPEWEVWRYGANMDFSLYSGWMWRHAYSGQYSSQPLISAEQMSFGGMSSVRGYTESEARGDIANLYKSEVWSPQWLPGTNFLVFYDQGHRNLRDAPANQPATQWLRSVGFGARWQYQEIASVTLDFAYAIDDGAQTSSGSGKIHSQIMFRF